jgi:Na+/melibiose symporter-like transporter
MEVGMKKILKVVSLVALSLFSTLTFATTDELYWSNYTWYPEISPILLCMIATIILFTVALSLYIYAVQGTFGDKKWRKIIINSAVWFYALAVIAIIPPLGDAMLKGNITVVIMAILTIVSPIAIKFDDFSKGEIKPINCSKGVSFYVGLVSIFYYIFALTILFAPK